MDDLFTFAKQTGFEKATEKDSVQLQTATQRVYRYMSDGQWHSIQDIAQASGVWSGDRRFRDLRQLGYTIEKRQDGPRSFSYRLVK